VRCIQPLCHLSKPLKEMLFLVRGRGLKQSFATALLPFRFAAPVYSGSHPVVNACRRIGLQARQHVAVQIERERDAGMTGRS
jgi:hypothetical protein